MIIELWSYADVVIKYTFVETVVKTKALLAFLSFSPMYVQCLFLTNNLTALTTVWHRFFRRRFQSIRARQLP